MNSPQYSSHWILTKNYNSHLLGLRLGPKTVASLLATNTDLQYIKCVAWCPGLESDPASQLLAVGQANGKVALTTFSKIPDPRGIKGREYGELLVVFSDIQYIFLAYVEKLFRKLLTCHLQRLY